MGPNRAIPADYAAWFVELAYATTVHGAQGETVHRAHVAIGETTGAAAAYVAMTRGGHSNVAYLVAENIDEARKQWVEVFSRDRADLGPANAKRQALDAVDRYGSQKRRQRAIGQWGRRFRACGTTSPACSSPAEPAGARDLTDKAFPCAQPRSIKV